MILPRSMGWSSRDWVRTCPSLSIARRHRLLTSPLPVDLEAHPDLAISDQTIDLVNSVLSDPVRLNPPLGGADDAAGPSSSSAPAWDQDEVLPDANRQVL